MAVLQIDLNKPHWTLRIVTKIAVSGISRTKEIPIYVPPNMKIRQPAKKNHLVSQQRKSLMPQMGLETTTISIQDRPFDIKGETRQL